MQSQNANFKVSAFVCEKAKRGPNLPNFCLTVYTLVEQCGNAYGPSRSAADALSLVHYSQRALLLFIASTEAQGVCMSKSNCLHRIFES